ncbi:MAG TPA: NCS2 family permease, partial [Pirellulales bacterium]
VGLRNGRILDPVEMKLGLAAHNLTTIDVGVFLVGLLTTLALAARKIPGAILLGIVAAGCVAVAGGAVSLSSDANGAGAIFGLPKVERAAMFQLDLIESLKPTYWPFIALFVYVALFDMTGTLIGVGERAGLMKDGELPRMREAVLVDSAGSVLGSALGTSTVTSYIESIAGVEQGGRTGLTAVVAGVLLLASIAFSPLIQAFGGYTPATAAALVFVGSMMLHSVKFIEWDDPTEAFPAFIAMIGIPLTFSIADGLALGLIVHPCGKLLAGRWREITLMRVLLAASLVLYFLYVRTVLK